MTKATICHVRRHMAVHTQRFCSVFCTPLQISSHASTAFGVAGRSVSLTSGQFWTCVLSQRATVCRATVCRAMAKIRSTPRRLHRSRQARSTVCCSVSAYACFGVRTRYVPQSLPWDWAFPHRLVPFFMLGVRSQTRPTPVIPSFITPPILPHHLPPNHHQLLLYPT